MNSSVAGFPVYLRFKTKVLLALANAKHFLQGPHHLKVH